MNSLFVPFKRMDMGCWLLRSCAPWGISVIVAVAAYLLHVILIVYKYSFYIDKCTRS